MTNFRRSLMITIIFYAILVSATAFSQVPDNSMLIEKALDDPAQINFRNVSLEEAFDKLGKTIGVKFDVEPAALGQLPYGRLTELSAVQLQGMAWRDALGELLKPLALRFQTGKDRIYILGTVELMRQPQRLNLVELDALVKLQNSNLNDGEDKLLEQIRQVTGISFGLIENGRRREKADEDLAKKILGRLPQPASEILDLYCKKVFGSDAPASWYVKAELKAGRAENIDIIILPVQKLNDLKLERRINIEFKDQPAQTILHDLAQQAGMDIRYEPGCFYLLDKNLRDNCSLVMRGGAIKSALEALAGMTGLAYSYDEKGIYVEAGDTLKQSAVKRIETVTYANPLILTLTARIPGTDYESMILIREEDLKEEDLLVKWDLVKEQIIRDFIQYLRNYPSGGTAEKK